ncbi:SARP family transcriptional regulator [Micromonospora fulviviridis]|uniref:XRE family transcriptional regulator n=1 Tax=Micromonospora fulviviridis TaxID=47860 RepID=UPI001664ABE0|nr:XRE family transcriptional regulator [Micromonospora fulviviridis]GGR87790.1 SARP family transcriptional regulator [Micromonospora fulviviridis]
MGGEVLFGVELRVARHAAGLTLEELAEASGVSVRALSDMERGRALGPQRRTVVLIADALKLDGERRTAFLAKARAGRTRPASLAAAPSLCELPVSISDFTGRVAELAWLLQLVESDEAMGRSGTAVISGGAGMGKTTLVIRAAHQMRDQFPGGVHFVDALGMSERPVASGEILTRVLRAIGVRDAEIPRDTAEQAGLYRQLLREKRVLMMVDNAGSEAQVRPLMPGGGRSRLLITSRRLLAGLEDVQRLHLDPMPDSDASDLLRRILAERADVPDDHDLKDLVDLLGGLPLAVRIVGNRLVSRPIWTAADLITRLSVAERRLDQLAAGDLKVAAAFGMSYEQLPPVTRQVFRRAALARGPDFSAWLAAVAGEVTIPEAEDHLDDLVDLGLMQAAHSGRYRLHDLVRLYAQQRLEVDEPTAAVTAAHRRVNTWLLANLTDAGSWFSPQPPSTDGSSFCTAADAEAWIRAEAELWLAALDDAATAGDHQAVVDAVQAANWFAGRWRHWPHWSRVFTLAYDCAVQLDDLGRQAGFLNRLARTYTVLGQNASMAVGYAERALALARSAADGWEEAAALQNLARARVMLGDLPGGLDAVRAAEERFRHLDDVNEVCQTLLGRGDIARSLGNIDEALDCFQRVLDMVEDPASGMTPSIAAMTLPYVLSMSARALGLIGRNAEAVPRALRAADLFGSMQMLDAQARVLRILGEDLYRADQAAQARDCLLRAAEIYGLIGSHDEASRCRDKAVAVTGDASRS